MSLIDLTFTFLFWLATCLICYRIGLMEGLDFIKKHKSKIKALIVLLPMISCQSIAPATMTYVGQVVLIEGCQVCVSYGNVGKSDNSKTLGCFAHYEGHAYQIGDTYPDPEKHSTGTPVSCGDPVLSNTPKTKNK